MTRARAVEPSSRAAAADVGVVIVTHNRLALLRQCLASVRQQTAPPAFILVIDSGSTDGTAAWLDAQPDLRVCHLPNRGGAWAYHVGIREAQAQGATWLLLLDDDCEVAPTYLADGLALARAMQAADPADAVFTGRVWEAGRKVFFHGVENGRWRSAPLHPDRPCPSEALGFPFLLLHRSVVEAVGLPYTFWFIVNDDVEWTRRMRRHGFRLHLLPVEAGVHHARHERHRVRWLGRSLAGYAPWKTYYVLRNGIILARLEGAPRLGAALRHLPHVAARLLHPDRRRERLRLALRGWWDGLRFDLSKVE
ncbi:MAG: glycosyltransferase [Bacteroidetes bacterium]|nr:MAG: glycosyltransferase [Bacteroidota bacterium]